MIHPGGLSDDESSSNEDLEEIPQQQACDRDMKQLPVPSGEWFHKQANLSQDECVHTNLLWSVLLGNCCINVTVTDCGWPVDMCGTEFSDLSAIDLSTLELQPSELLNATDKDPNHPQKTGGKKRPGRKGALQGKGGGALMYGGGGLSKLRARLDTREKEDVGETTPRRKGWGQSESIDHRPVLCIRHASLTLAPATWHALCPLPSLSVCVMRGSWCYRSCSTVRYGTVASP